MESDVAQALRLLLEQNQGQNLWDEKTVLELSGAMPIPLGIPTLALPLVDLNLYDQLFLAEDRHVVA
jgi:hypothetical protein